MIPSLFREKIAVEKIMPKGTDADPEVEMTQSECISVSQVFEEGKKDPGYC